MGKVPSGEAGCRLREVFMPFLQVAQLTTGLCLQVLMNLSTEQVGNEEAILLVLRQSISLLAAYMNT